MGHERENSRKKLKKLIMDWGLFGLMTHVDFLSPAGWRTSQVEVVLV
jgi:hypothetical protein